MLTNVDKKDPKSSEKFLCDLCDYRCSKQSLFNRHLLTPKHQKKAEMLTNVDTNVDKKCQKMQKSSDKKYICECGKEYNHRQSLSLHKKKCGHLEEIKKEDIKEEKTDLHHLFLETLKQNQELQKQVIELAKYFIKNNN